MHPRAAEEGEPEPSSTFTLANQTGSHSGLAPLHYAAQKGHADIVKWLIEEAGAMPELEDSEGEVRTCSLSFLARRTPSRAQGLTARALARQTPLHKASHRGHLDVCRFLISRDVDVNTPDSDGWTALHNAASRGWLDVARLLVEAGAHVDAQSTHRYTALMNAASKGQLPLVNFLLKKGADP
ncbi:ankyrin repeat-containing domain protein, partial [Rhodotorula diobovata]